MALDFEATNSEDVVLGTNLSSLQAVSGATIMAWVIPEGAGIAAEQFVLRFSIGTAVASSRAHISRLAGDAWRAGGRRLDADAFQSADSAAGTADAGVTYHVCARLAYTTGQLQLFVNGALVDTTAVAGWTGNSSNTVSLEANVGQSNSDANYLDGIVDGVRVYNRALSAEEIANIYAARGRDSIINGLIHHWSFNEAADGTSAAGADSVRDKGSVPLDGTPTNTPIYASAISFSRKRRR